MHVRAMLAKVAGLLFCLVWIAGCDLVPRLTPRASTGVTQIAYVGPDDQVYLADQDSSAARQLKREGASATDQLGWTYRWPTYSRDGQHIAFAGYLSQSGDLVSAAVLVADTNQASARVVLESSELAPIYLYWSPDNRHVAALLQRQQELELQLLDSAGQENARSLIVGQPLYWSWSPDATSIAVHVGGDVTTNPEAWVGVLHVGAGDASEERFSDPPGGFRAPAWAPDGSHVAYATLAGGISALAVRTATGQIDRIATSATDLAFNWSPPGDWIAFSSQMAGSALYAGVEVARADGRDRHRLSSDPLVAFYWAPDGKRLALLGIDRAARQLTWSTVQTDGNSSRLPGSFSPSGDFAFQLPFFDQYAQSSSVWSPESRKLVYAADDGTGSQNGSSSGEQVMVVDADGQASPLVVARGSVAAWSPAR